MKPSRFQATGLALRFSAALKAARITPCFISYYLPVSRQAVGNWVHTDCEVHVTHAERVLQVTVALEAAVRDNTLPRSTPRAVHSTLGIYGVEADPLKIQADPPPT
jgi:hypothetical protein